MLNRDREAAGTSFAELEGAQARMGVKTPEVAAGP